MVPPKLDVASKEAKLSPSLNINVIGQDVKHHGTIRPQHNIIIVGDGGGWTEVVVTGDIGTAIRTAEVETSRFGNPLGLWTSTAKRLVSIFIATIIGLLQSSA